jgi:hypothetical protein
MERIKEQKRKEGTSERRNILFRMRKVYTGKNRKSVAIKLGKDDKKSTYRLCC